MADETIRVEPSYMATVTASEPYDMEDQYQHGSIVYPLVYFDLVPVEELSIAAFGGRRTGRAIRALSFDIAKREGDEYVVKEITCKGSWNIDFDFPGKGRFPGAKFTLDNTFGALFLEELFAGVYLSAESNGVVYAEYRVKDEYGDWHTVEEVQGTYELHETLSDIVIHMRGTRQLTLTYQIYLMRNINPNQGTPDGVDVEVEESTNSYVRADGSGSGARPIRYVKFEFLGVEGDKLTVRFKALKSDVKKDATMPYGLSRWLPKGWGSGQTSDPSLARGKYYDVKDVNFGTATYTRSAIFREAIGEPVDDGSGKIFANNGKIVIDL